MLSDIRDQLGIGIDSVSVFELGMLMRGIRTEDSYGFIRVQFVGVHGMFALPRLSGSTGKFVDKAVGVRVYYKKYLNAGRRTLSAPLLENNRVFGNNTMTT